MIKGAGHIIVGATGTGKSTFVKNLLSVVNPDCIAVYDVNNEYQNFFPYPLTDFESFTRKVTRLKKAVVVFEESTIFLNNRGTNQNLIDLLVKKRHNQNYIILVFHSLRSVPRYVFELCNYITVFKTNDNSEMTARELKDYRLEEIMNRVKASEIPYFSETLKIY